MFGCTHEVWEGLQGLEHGIARRGQQCEQFITSLCPLTPPPPARCPPGRTVPCKTELLNPAVPLSTLLPPASSYCQPDWNITQTLNTEDGRTLWSGLEKYFHHIPTRVQLHAVKVSQVKLCMNLCAISWRLLLVTQTSGIFDTMMFGLVKVTLDTACDMMPPSIDGEYDDEQGAEQMETMEMALLSPHHLSTVP